MKFKSWKTTISGAALCVFAIVFFLIDKPIEGGMAAVAGIGLLSAKDNNVTGGTRQQ
jgi:hypothetical protein